MQSQGSLSIFFNDYTKRYSYFNNWIILLYDSTVLLYIIHVLCCPRIYHNQSTQDNHHLNVAPMTSSYPNIFSMFTSYECTNCLGYIYPFLISLDASNHDHTNIIYCQLDTFCFHMSFLVLIINVTMVLLRRFS